MTIAAEHRTKGGFSRHGFVWTYSQLGHDCGEGRFGRVAAEGQTPEEAVTRFNAKARSLGILEAKGGIQTLDIATSLGFSDFADAVYGLCIFTDPTTAKAWFEDSGTDAKAELSRIAVAAVGMANQTGQTITLGGSPLQAVLPGNRVSNPIAQFRPVNGYVVLYAGSLPRQAAKDAIDASNALLRAMKGRERELAEFVASTANIRYGEEGLL